MPRVAPAYLDAKRSQILDAAISCFARDGFHRTTVHDIAREAGVSAGAIYRHFTSKEDVVAAIAEEHRTPRLDVFDGEGDVVALFQELIDASFRDLVDPDEQRWRRVTVQLWSEALRDDRIMAILRTGRDVPIQRIADLVRRGQSEGVFPGDVDPTSVARMCASLFYGLVLQLATEPGLDVESYVEAVRFTLRAVVALGSTPRRTRRGT